MPLATLRAFADHGTVPGMTAEIDPGADLAALERAGIDMEKVTAELLVDGVKQFEDAMNSLFAGIEQERAAASPASRRRSTQRFRTTRPMRLPSA